VNQGGLGQYDDEYRACSCFWGAEPGKYVRLLTKHLSSGRALDLGAGEGKNAIYLAKQGFEVTAVECSEYAINNFRRSLSHVDPGVRDRIQIVMADVRTYLPQHEYEAVISYGLLHCLRSMGDAYKVVRSMHKCTVSGGYNVVVVLTNRVNSPCVQQYLEILEISRPHLEHLYEGWKIVSLEDTVLEEKHPTSNVVHQHSIIRLFAQKERCQ
jgi:cyclopropane fatty-acyl-phospholipid synthase-like methyltransferase